jgi:concanavalin A-like lectin/glucanase superfamily protein
LTNFLYRRKGIVDLYSQQKQKIHDLEINTNTVTPISQPTVTQAQIFQFQSANFTGIGDEGQLRINATTTPTSTIDEETNAAVAAYATFDDVGGNATGVVAGSPMWDIPLLDGEAKTANYHVNPTYFAWNSSTIPTVTHTKAFIAGNAFRCNVPGIQSADQSAYVYYTSNTAFNISASISASLWFYPTDLSGIGAEVFRFLMYRWIDASNWFIVTIKSSDDKIYVFTNEAAAQVKLVSANAVNLNAWNLIIFTYNPSTNALVIYLNNVSTSSTAADTAPNVYTANANLYLGGLPTFPAKRFTGYLDNFVFWTGLILSSTQAGNMWNHGTIV